MGAREGSRGTGEFQGSGFCHIWVVVKTHRHGKIRKAKLVEKDVDRFQSRTVEFKMSMGLPSGGIQK